MGTMQCFDQHQQFYNIFRGWRPSTQCYCDEYDSWMFQDQIYSYLCFRCLMYSDRRGSHVPSISSSTSNTDHRLNNMKMMSSRAEQWLKQLLVEYSCKFVSSSAVMPVSKRQSGEDGHGSRHGHKRPRSGMSQHGQHGGQGGGGHGTRSSHVTSPQTWDQSRPGSWPPLLGAGPTINIPDSRYGFSSPRATNLYGQVGEQCIVQSLSFSTELLTPLFLLYTVDTDLNDAYLSRE